MDDATITPTALCDEYPGTGLFIENGGLEMEAPKDSTYAWFGSDGVAIKAGTSDPNEPQPRAGNNFL